MKFFLSWSALRFTESILSLWGLDFRMNECRTYMVWSSSALENILDRLELASTIVNIKRAHNTKFFQFEIMFNSKNNRKGVPFYSHYSIGYDQLIKDG